MENLLITLGASETNEKIEFFFLSTCYQVDSA